MCGFFTTFFDAANRRVFSVDLVHVHFHNFLESYSFKFRFIITRLCFMHSFVTLPVHGIVNSIDDHQQVCNLAKMSLSRWTDERITNMSTSDFRIQKQWTIVRMRRKMEYTCWCIGRPFGILLTLPRHRAISGQYLMNDYFIAATNSSDH